MPRDNRRTFNRGKWQQARERFQLADRQPPVPASEASAFAGIVPAVMKRLGLEEQHWLEAVTDKWDEIVGLDVAKHTRIGGFQKKNLTVYVDNTVWLSELTRYGQKKMLANLQARFGADRIRSVSLTLDPGK